MSHKLGKAEAKVSRCFSAQDDGQQIAGFSLPVDCFLKLIFSSLEEMKDSFEGSEEPDSTLPKGKDMEEGLSFSQRLIQYTSLFLSGILLVSTAAKLKFTSF